MMKQKLRLGSGLWGGVLLLTFCVVLNLAAQDFDFYMTDLISRESYRRISMDFRDASLKTILKIFSEQSGLNFIAAESIEDKSLTLYLEDVPLKEALDKIMSANNLKYELDAGGKVFVVKETGVSALQTETRVYKLKYARLKGSRLDQAINTGGVQAAPTGEGAGASAGASSGGASSGGASSGAASGGSGGGVGGIEEAVQNVLTENGKLVADGRTNSLIVTDVAAQFPMIDKIIAFLDTPTPQVMIEVEMLDVSKKSLDEMGVSTSANLMKLTGAERQTRFPNFFADGIPGVDPPTFTYGTLSSAVFSAVFDLLSTDTKTKFLARPRILTLSNETAEIKITTNEAISKTSSTTSGTGGTTSSEEIVRFETGVSLKVTPQVDLSSGAVTMFIQPVVVNVKNSPFVIDGQQVKDPEIRSSATTLMVRNGETIVVGGLIKTNDETRIKKIPFLGDIPLAGAMFRHKYKNTEERELVVFITPHIIGDEGAMALAKAPVVPTIEIPSREQARYVVRQEKIDSTLERWEN